MKVMTWNIRLGIQQGLEPIAEIITRQNPDVLALQEVGRHWWMGPQGDTARNLAISCGFDDSFFIPCIRTSGAAEYGHAVLSRFPLHHRRVVPLPHVVDEPRCVAVCSIEAPGHPLRLLSTHLSYLDDRAAQGDALRRLADEDNVDLIMGDLNTSDEPWLTELKKTYTDSDPTAQTTFPPTNSRIDYILSRGLELASGSVISTGDASDHLPMIAVFTST